MRKYFKFDNQSFPKTNVHFKKNPISSIGFTVFRTSDILFFKNNFITNIKAVVFGKYAAHMV